MFPATRAGGLGGYTQRVYTILRGPCSVPTEPLTGRVAPNYQG